MDKTQHRATAPKATFVARAPDAKSRKKVAKPKAAGIRRSRLEFVAIVAFRASVILAGLTTIYIVLLALNPVFDRWLGTAAIPGALQIGPSMFENVAAGTWFFWLEVCAIVIGVRIYDRLKHERTDYKNAHQQMTSLVHLLFALIEDIDERRYAFAVALDTSQAKNGRYDTNLAVLDRLLHIKITEFLARLAIDGIAAPAARPFIERTSSLMNRMYQRTYWAVEEAMHAYRADNKEALEKALDDIFTACDPWEAPSAREGETSERLVDLYTSADDAREAMRPPRSRIFFLAPAA